MGYIPHDAQWYLADIVMQITVEDDPRILIHTNLTLIRADSPEEAYQSALKLGVEQEASWGNPDGKMAKFVFSGLRDLNVIHGKLEHGTELMYEEDQVLDQAEVTRWITPKEELGVFAPIEPHSDGPNYSSRKIMDRIREQFPHLFDSEGRRIR